MAQQQTMRETEIKKFIKTYLGRSTWNVSRTQTGRPSADRARATGLGLVPLVGSVGTVHCGSQAKTRRWGAGEAHGVFSEGPSRGRPWGKITRAVGEGALGTMHLLVALQAAAQGPCPRGWLLPAYSLCRPLRDAQGAAAQPPLADRPGRWRIHDGTGAL